MKPDVRRPPERLVDREGDLGRLLRAVAETEPPPGARERVWRRLRTAGLVASPLARPTGRGPSIGRAFWPGFAAAAVAAAVAAVALRSHPVDDAPLATVCLASGEVLTAPGGDGAFEAARPGAALPPASRVLTRAASRAYLRFADAGALFGDDTAARLGRPAGAPDGIEVALDAGEVSLAARPRPDDRALVVVAKPFRVRVVGTVFQVRSEASRGVEVRVAEGVVAVTGPDTDVRVHAGESWSSRGGAGRAAMTPWEVALARALVAAAPDEAPLRVEGASAFAVDVDGLAVGRPPVRMLAPPGARTIVGVTGDRRVAGAVEVVPGRETVYRLAWREGAPAPAADAVAAVEPSPGRPKNGRHARSAGVGVPATFAPPSMPDTPPIPAPAPASIDPLDEALARVASAGSPDELDKARYALATLLAVRGRYAEAVELYAVVAAGGRAKAELSLYEVGRLKKRYLGDSRGAASAFADYGRRYPEGALAPDADLSLIESLVASAAYGEARAAMDRFLLARPDSERRAEVRLLRANLLRDRGDCRAARADYEAVAAGSGPETDDALFHAAGCDRELGDTEAARDRLRRYLERFPAGRHRAEAERALGSR